MGFQMWIDGTCGPTEAYIKVGTSDMKGSASLTLEASLIWTGAWLLGIGESMWPSHPQIALFLLTVVCLVVFVQVLAVSVGPRTASGK